MKNGQWDLIERLATLDPLDGYPRRGAAAVSQLAGASGFRLTIDGDVTTGSRAPQGDPAAKLTLRAGSTALGTLELYGVLTEEGREFAERGARLFSQGVRNARRLDGSYGQRTYEDIQTMLERTGLTPRERDVVGRLLSGASTRQIAGSTGLTIATVNTYLKRIFHKLRVHSRVELVARVTGTRGVVPSEPQPPAQAPVRHRRPETRSEETDAPV
ncbi:MAG TPA: LuxR family transcriptional regulator [Polyangiaceae bacterium]|nr:LuxR family transcriptional regulator [Polyangiaceae bacterium]